jgi:ketosteroid isomerase-like protein
MVMTMIVKRMLRSGMDALNRGDVDAAMAGWAEDALYEFPSDISVGGRLKGKEEIAGWFRRWIEEYPKRKLTMGNVCLQHTLLPSPRNVVMVEWSCEETNREGKDFKYNGVTVFEVRNMKSVRSSEYISFVGLPRIPELLAA